MHISDWSSDVCSSDLKEKPAEHTLPQRNREPAAHQRISVGRRAGRMGSIIRPILGARIHAHRISYVLAPITPRYMLSITAETTFRKSVATAVGGRFSRCKNGRAACRERVC